jgi:hypothetical protein
MSDVAAKDLAELGDESYIESIGDDGVGLFVGFARRLDRVGHVVSLVEGEKCTPLFASLEGDDQDDWPPSPPLQEVHIEKRDKNLVAMLVGMAGDSHWSVAMDPMAGGVGITVAVACRLKQHPVQIGSRYGNLIEGLSPQTDSEGRIVWQLGEHRVAIEVVSLSEYPTPETPYDPQGFEIKASINEEPFPKTIQWRYLIRLLS